MPSRHNIPIIILQQTSRYRRGRSLHEALDPLQKISDLLGTVLEILSSIDDQHFLSRVALEPLLVLVVDEFEVVEGDLSFFWTHAALGSLMALLRGAFEVDDLGAIDFGHLFEAAVE